MERTHLNRQKTKIAKEFIMPPRFVGNIKRIMAFFPEGNRDSARAWQLEKLQLRNSLIN